MDIKKLKLLEKNISEQLMTYEDYNGNEELDKALTNLQEELDIYIENFKETK